MGGSQMNLATRGVVYVGLVMETRLAAMGEPIAGPRLMSISRCSLPLGAMP